MQLLCFAHRGEAQAFIDSLGLKQAHHLGYPCFKGEGIDLLVTGEGVQNVTQSLASFLALNHGSVRQVFNFGVAGSLREECEVGSIYKVRTCYRQRSDYQPEFKSYTSADVDARVDCISSLGRVVSQDRAKYLASFAQLVDREAWAVGSVCRMFEIPFYSRKIVADIAGVTTNCSSIVASASQFGEKLFQSYIEDSPADRTATHVTFCLPSGFYATSSQRHRLDKLAKTLARKNETKSETNFILNEFQSEISEIRKVIPKPKERTSRLIEHMQTRANPFLAKIRAAIRSELSHYNSRIVSVRVDDDLEDESLHFSGRISSPAELPLIKKDIDAIPVARLQKLLRGDVKLDL